MTVRIAQFVHATHDVVDESFCGNFLKSRRSRPIAIEALSDALAGRGNLPCYYNLPLRRSSRELVRDKGRALKWIRFTTVGIDVALSADCPTASESRIPAM